MDDEQLILLASAACHGWHVTPDNFGIVADLVKRGYLSVHDGDEGAINVSATDKGIKRAFSLKIIEKGVHPWSTLIYGSKHPAVIKRRKPNQHG